MPLKVIGAGFGRTGTDSMREALSILGFGPCHHMFEVISNETQKQRWRALVQGEPPDWESLFDGFASSVDWPSAYYWRELAAAYPEALVILTNRSSESWWNSFEKTLLPGIVRSTDPLSLGLALIAAKVFQGRMAEREHAISTYEANVRDVIASIPTKRLLIHNLGDGWEPLCRHLSVSVPDKPYPSQNSAGDFNARTSR